MSAAERRPSAIASIRVRGPLAASPPDQIRQSWCAGVVVDLDRAARADLGPVVAERLEVDRLPDREDHGVGVEQLAVRVVELGANRPSSSNTDVTPIVSMPATRRPRRRSWRGRGGHERDALVLGLLDLEVVGRHLVARLERDHRDLAGPGAGGGAGHVDRLGHRRPLVGLDLLLARRAACGRVVALVVGRPQRGAGGVHRDVAAADHDDPLPDVDREAPVHVDQELDRLEDPVGSLPRCRGRVRAWRRCRGTPRRGARAARRG